MTKRLSRLLSDVAKETLADLKEKHGFTDKEYETEIDYVKSTIADLASDVPHWQEYLDAWH